MATWPLGDILRYQAGRKAEAAYALVYPDAQLTWQELECRANRRARLYRARGVSKDDMVIVALSNGPDFHEALFAIWKLGATPAVLSPHLSRREFSAAIELIQPTLIIGGTIDASDETDWKDGIVSVRGDAETTGLDDSPIASQVARYWKAMSSGGSTGRPKVIVDHMPAVFDPDNSDVQEAYKMPADGVVLNPGPLYHNAPFLFTNLALFTGSMVIGMKRFDAEETLRIIEAYRVNWVCLVPTMMHRIWSLPDTIRKRYDLSSLKAVWHMAAPCPLWLKEAWIDWLGADRIWERYAGTERFGGTVIRGDEWLTRKGSVGRASGGSKVKIVGEDGAICSPGELGELYFFPPGGELPSHYLGAQPKLDSQGWLSIGDMGQMDADGYVYLVDRRTDLIVRGGANIYPAEVEAAIEEYPSVASSIVIGLPCEEMGARVHAIVQLRDVVDINVADLHEFLKTVLARYKLPESYEVTAVPLRDEAGKVRRSALRDERVRWSNEGQPFKLKPHKLAANSSAVAGGTIHEG